MQLQLSFLFIQVNDQMWPVYWVGILIVLENLKLISKNNKLISLKKFKKSILAPVKKEQMTKFELRNVPQTLLEAKVAEIDDETEWRILFNQITQLLQECPAKGTEGN